MKSRKDKFPKTSKGIKTLVVTLVISLSIVSGISVVFANEDLSKKITNWFDKQRNNSIEQIEKAIISEKEKQIVLLKNELQKQIKESKSQIESFTETEKQKRVDAVRNHAENLLKEMNIDNTEEQKKIAGELDALVTKAINQINQVASNQNSTENEQEVVEATEESVEVIDGEAE